MADRCCDCGGEAMRGNARCASCEQKLRQTQKENEPKKKPKDKR